MVATHPAGPAGTDIIRETVDVCGSPLQNDSLDLVDGTGGHENRRVCHSLVGITAATEGDIEDLGSLCHATQLLLILRTQGT